MIVKETIDYLLHQCSKTKAFRHGLALHACVFKIGLQSDIFITNHVLNMYAKHGKTEYARKVFDGMFERKNLVSWSAMVSGYVRVGENSMALDLFSRFHLVPNEFILASAISACANLLAVIQGRQIHSQSLKIGFASISFVSNSLITLYMKCGYCDDALSVFNGSSSELNLVSFNALISGFLENKQYEKGLQAFTLMKQQGIIPDRFTFVGAIRICIDLDYCQTGLAMHCQTIKHNLDSTPFVGNVAITMYSRFLDIEGAEKMFRLIEEKDVLSWNTLIGACSRCADYLKGLNLFREMIYEEDIVEPDDFTFSSVLGSCVVGLASLRHGKEIHAHLIRNILNPDIGVGNALVGMYAKCGSIKYAYCVFTKMPLHNIVSWNTIIAGFGTHGLGERALQIFEQMKGIGVKPDSLTVLGVLISCNHAGLVDKGKHLFNLMEETYKISPNVEHFSCLIDMLGRAKRLTEAEEYISKFPFGQNLVVLGTLLSACRLHGEVQIGERIARKLLKLDPKSSSPYVLLSNLYALDEMWDDAREARKMLKSSGLVKEAGYSLIEVKGKLERFTIGDFSHSESGEIKDTLRMLTCTVGLDQVFENLEIIVV